MAQHKWHKEIKAWADGEEIEWLSPTGQWIILNNPVWGSANDEYRIKPQPKEPQYAYAWHVKDTDQIEWYFDEPEGIENDEWHRYIGKIKLESHDE